MKRLSYTVFVIALLTAPLTLFSQEESELIEWCEEYPDLDNPQKKSFIKKIDALIFGSKPNVITKPVSLINDAENNLWALCQGNKTLLKIENKSKISNDVFKGKTSFPSLVSVCLLPENRLLFTDSYLNKIYLYSIEEEKLSCFATLDTLSRPTGIVYSDITNKIWITETGKHRVSVYNIDGSLDQTIGCRGSDRSEFNFPTHICVDKNGDIYIVDAMNFRIQIFSGDGKFIAMFGKQGDSSGSLARPKGIACDTNGNIYIADALFNAIQIFNKKGEFLYHFGGKGTEKGEFWMPSGIHIDNKNYLYVADSFNNRIQVFKINN